MHFETNMFFCVQAKFMQGVATVAAVSLEIGYPTMASAPHSIVNGMKNLLAIAAVTDITFKVWHESSHFVNGSRVI